MASSLSILLPLMVMVVVVFINGGTVVKSYPEKDLVKKLPGQPEVAFKQYSGYVDVDLAAGRSLFYYFVEAHGDSQFKPLTLWLTGGPGCSSIGQGAFTEIGPFLPNGDGHSLRSDKMSWNRVSNLLFVDAPAGVGWSYSNRSSDYNFSMESFTNDMYIFLMKWLEKFPEFKYTDLFLTGETYAGHYIPNLVNVLLKHNQNANDFKFQIKGVAIGNPVLKLDRDLAASYEFLWSHGIISDEIFLTIKRECDFEVYVRSTSQNVSKTCNTALDTAIRMTGNINFYSVILDTCPSNVEEQLRLKKTVTKISYGVDVCMEYEIDGYFNLPQVQHALHANRTKLPHKWSKCSQLLQYSDEDNIKNMLPLLKIIAGQKIPVWIFSGDQDAVFSLLGSRTLVRELAEELKYNITVPYGAWHYKTQVGGWVTEYGNVLTFATVKGGGQMVAYSQPGRALQLFKSFVHGERLTRRNT